MLHDEIDVKEAQETKIEIAYWMKPKLKGSIYILNTRVLFIFFLVFIICLSFHLANKNKMKHYKPNLVLLVAHASLRLV